MRKSYVFKTCGDFTTVNFKRNQKINTPYGVARYRGQFIRGLRFWVSTSKGTFKASDIVNLNPAKNGI